MILANGHAFDFHSSFSWDASRGHHPGSLGFGPVRGSFSGKGPLRSGFWGGLTFGFWLYIVTLYLLSLIFIATGTWLDGISKKILPFFIHFYSLSEYLPFLLCIT